MPPLKMRAYPKRTLRYPKRSVLTQKIAVSTIQMRQFQPIILIVLILVYNSTAKSQCKFSDALFSYSVNGLSEQSGAVSSGIGAIEQDS